MESEIKFNNLVQEDEIQEDEGRRKKTHVRFKMGVDG